MRDAIFPNLLIEIKRNRYSQKGLAEYIGISAETMSRKLNGRVDFTLSEMQKIRSVFPDCTLDYLFREYGAKE